MIIRDQYKDVITLEWLLFSRSSVSWAVPGDRYTIFNSDGGR